ncbi:MAG: urea transporter [Cognaticolwellia sp.]|jgi:urea transporter
MKHTLHHVSKTIFRSFSQVMLQQNTLTGLLFCLGIAINSVTMLLGALLGFCAHPLEINLSLNF